MIKIGDFARLSQVSVVTLRYYDEMDLLKPVRVDSFTGYRFYSADQLPRLNRVLALKDLGFSLTNLMIIGPLVFGMFLLGSWFVKTGAIAHPENHPRLFRSMRWLALPPHAVLALSSSMSTVTGRTA